jgi:glucokinase
MSGSVVAIDVGGTACKGAVVDRYGVVQHLESRPTGREHGVDAVVETIGDFAVALAERAADDVISAGVVVPGLVDDARGMALYSANIGWRDLPLAERVRQRIDRPVALSHDVRTGGLAEGLIGAARGCPDFLFLPIGTGIAAAIVLDGTPYAGANAYGGEIGHAPVVPHGELCACGQRGCLETYASAASIPRRYVVAGGANLDTAEEVLARAAAGDQLAMRIWAEAIDALATALASYSQLLDPALVVLGGGLAAAGAALFDPLRAELATRLTFRPPPPLVPAALGSQAACLGAAILAWRAAGEAAAGTDWAPYKVGPAEGESA